MVANNEFFSELIPENECDYRSQLQPVINKLNLKIILYYLAILFCFILPIGFLFLTLSKLGDSWLVKIINLAVFVIFSSAGFFLQYLNYHLAERRKHLYNSIKAFQRTRNAILSRRFILYLRGFGQESFMEYAGNRGPTPEDALAFKSGESLLPLSIVEISRKYSLPIIALGNVKAVRGEKNILFLFCEDTVWENVFRIILLNATIVVISLFKTTRESLKSLTYFSNSLNKEIKLLLQNESILKKVLVLHNDYHLKCYMPKHVLELINSAKWHISLVNHLGHAACELTPTANLPKSLNQYFEEKFNRNIEKKRTTRNRFKRDSLL